MTNDQEQNLFAPTQGLSRAPLFHRGAVEQGGYGQPDPGSGIQGGASTVPWTISVEPGGSDGAPDAGTAQSASAPAPTGDMPPMAPSIRRAAATRQWPMPSQNYQELLRGLTGRSVVADFLIGTGMQRRSGVIAYVGAGYFVLRDPLTQARTGCDLLALRFLTVLPEAKNDGSAVKKFSQL